MPHDTDFEPATAEGWAFWTLVAITGGVVVGVSIASDRWWGMVLGLFAVFGALEMTVAELRRDRASVERRARRAEQAQIRRAFRDAAKRRLDELDGLQP